jgi:hypothetical protein
MMNFNKKMLVKEVSFYVNETVNKADDFNGYINACAIKTALLKCTSIHHLCSSNEVIAKVEKMAFNMVNDAKIMELWLEILKANYGKAWNEKKESVEKHMAWLEKMEEEQAI